MLATGRVVPEQGEGNRIESCYRACTFMGRDGPASSPRRLGLGERSQLRIGEHGATNYRVGSELGYLRTDVRGRWKRGFGYHEIVKV